MHLQVPLQPRHRQVLSTVATSIAMREGFTLDQVADLRVVMDEIYNVMTRVAADNTMLWCACIDNPSSLTVQASVAVKTDATVPVDDVGWHVLAELTDGIRLWCTSARVTLPDGQTYDLNDC